MNRFKYSNKTLDKMSHRDIYVPDYDANYPSGLFHIIKHAKFVGFCADIEEHNRSLLLFGVIPRDEMEALFMATVLDLHESWCEDDSQGGGLSLRKQEFYKRKALNLRKAPEVGKYRVKKKQEEEEAAKEQIALAESSRVNITFAEYVMKKEEEEAEAEAFEEQRALAEASGSNFTFAEYAMKKEKDHRMAVKEQRALVESSRGNIAVGDLADALEAQKFGIGDGEVLSRGAWVDTYSNDGY